MTQDEIKQFITEYLNGLIEADRFVFQKKLQIMDSRHIQLGKSTGTKIGTEATQKIGFYGKTPVVQATAIGSPSGGSTQDAEARTAIDSIRTALINLGLTA